MRFILVVKSYILDDRGDAMEPVIHALLFRQTDKPFASSLQKEGRTCKLEHNQFCVQDDNREHSPSFIR